jgi:hypothetical protein
MSVDWLFLIPVPRSLVSSDAYLDVDDFWKGEDYVEVSITARPNTRGGLDVGVLWVERASPMAPSEATPGKRRTRRPGAK